MSITKRQFDLLQAMGINVWQRRDLSTQKNGNNTRSETNKAPSQGASPKTSDENKPATKTININLQALRNEQLFNDIIRCLGVNSSDLTAQNNQVDLGLFNWQFSHNQEIEFSHNCLKTPELTTLAHSPEMKKLLWQSIQALSA